MDEELIVALVLPGLLYVLPVTVLIIKKSWTPRRNIAVLSASMVVIVAFYAAVMVVDGVSPGTVISLAIGWLAPTAIAVIWTTQGIRQHERENTLRDDGELRWNLKRKARS